MDRSTDYWMKLYPTTYRALLSELRAEKEKFAHWKDKLEKERNEAYAQLKLQAQEAETTRRGLERARQEIVRQVTAISAEKDFLERENEELKERLEVERAGAGHCLMDLSLQKKRMSENVVGLEKELSELKVAARQSATLNSQLKKAMKHLASCRRKKCSVCAYTKASFGEYAGRNDKKLFACFQSPFQDLRNWMRPVPGQMDPLDKCLPDAQYPSSCLDKSLDSSCPGTMQRSSPYHSVRSDYSFRRTYSLGRGGTCMSSPSPSPSLPLSYLINPHISYIDEGSTVSESSSDSGHGEESFNIPPCPGESSFNISGCTCAYGPDESLTSSTSVPPTNRAFSSDSGFSSELYDPKQPTSTISSSSSSKGKLERSKWTASFRKLINRVSNRKPNATSELT
ncbi:hypothetical protein RUM43_003241 [Polyplax serrata]|uniref:Uncharacterized protein n=1 Tax=Polyplax serrata TaxID=468196 RepID=A0AAN8S6F2_POLSC